MSGIDNWTEADRDLYAVGTRAILDELVRKQEDWRAGVGLDSTATDAVVREHNAKMRDLEERHKAWLAGFLKDASGAADEPAPTQDVAAGGHGASASSSSGTDGHGSRQQPDPYAAELAEAERARAIAAMPMTEYAQRRAELGVRSATSMDRMFG